MKARRPSVREAFEAREQTAMKHNQPQQASAEGSHPVALVSETRRLKHAVERAFPGAWKTIEAALAVVAAGLLPESDKCIALILVGLSGVGKTLPLAWIMPDESDKELRECF